VLQAAAAAATQWRRMLDNLCLSYLPYFVLLQAFAFAQVRLLLAAVDGAAGRFK